MSSGLIQFIRDMMNCISFLSVPYERFDHCLVRNTKTTRSSLPKSDWLDMKSTSRSLNKRTQTTNQTLYYTNSIIGLVSASTKSKKNWQEVHFDAECTPNSNPINSTCVFYENFDQIILKLRKKNWVCLFCSCFLSSFLFGFMA